jgi:hypothetical protein
MSNWVLSYVISVSCAIIVGFPMWLVWKYVPDLFPFVIAWVIFHPLVNIFKVIDRI